VIVYQAAPCVNEELTALMQRFGEKLRWLRHQQQMTQRELADRLGFAAQSYINALESGKKKPIFIGSLRQATR
jgi:transcriptional regulator with XRE-family HTH domain